MKIVIGISILLIILALFFLTRKQKNTILLMGPSNSGKTTFFLQLQNKQSETVTSLQENIFTLKGKRIVDLPGHEKLFFKYHSYIKETKTIFYFIDSSTLLSNKKSIEMLYEILGLNIQLVIVCNKSDLLLALKKDKIKKIIEQEIEKIRKTKNFNMGEEYLGYEGEVFLLEHLPTKIDFVEHSIKESTDFINSYL
ncbi:hypothetical protein HK103_007278 [Boothiomyces macroporosus]|uniref:Signal recognition particle receptor subunit beta n=1 Tax=Boothiomyces macroporosus TaxID=261099 RepID=A0AAD5UCN4_9FUNG|nr:hypothetical protein HK103_007278 [Boothiomyces macroporosus]